jgi:3-oxoacyl-[acyl-carrier-protein] synthase III
VRVNGALRIAAATVALPGGRQDFEHAVSGGAVANGAVRSEAVGTLPVARAGETATTLALTAATDALAAAGVTAAGVGLLAHSWIFDPSSDDCTIAPRLARLLGAKHAVALGVRQMSNGGAIGLQCAAAQMLSEHRIEHSLVLTSDVHGEEAVWRWQPHVGTALGDAATAVLLSRDRGPLSIEAIVSNSMPEEELWWAERGPGGEVTVPPNVFRARRCVRMSVEQVFADAGLEPDDPRVVVTVLPRLDLGFVSGIFHALLPGGEVVNLTRDTGHLFSGDLAANLHHLYAERPLAPDEYGLVVNLGVGLTVTMLLVRGEREERP